MARDGREADGRTERGLTRRETLRSGGAFGVGGLVTAVTRTPSSTSASAAPAAGWTRTYDHPVLTRVEEMVHAPGGGYAFVGGDGPAAVAAVDDGGLVIGLSNADASHLARLDPSCEVEWSVTFPKPDPDVPAEYYPTDIVPAPDGGYVIVGTHPLGAGDPVQWAAKVDAGGNVEWSELYAFCGVFVGVVPASEDGDASYVVGSGFVDDCAGSPPVPALRGLTADGDVAWTTTYSTDGVTTEVEDLEGFVRTADGGYALGGTRNDGAAIVRKVSPDRSTAWVRAYEGPSLTSVVAAPDSGLAFSGSFTWYFTTVEVTLTRLDASGDVRWRENYAVDGRPASITSLLRTPDGAFVFGGAAEIREDGAGYPAYLTELASEPSDP